jgi:hypothetical protein
MTKIISQFKNSLTGEVYQIGAGEGGGATDPAIVEQIYADMRKFQKHTDDNLIGDDKNLVSVINQLITRVNQLERYQALYDDSFTLSMEETSTSLGYKVILENVSSGTYTISSNWNIQAQESQPPYDAISIVAIKAGEEKPSSADAFGGNDNVLCVWDIPSDTTGTTIQIDKNADLVVYLSSKNHIERAMESAGSDIEAQTNITATINNLKVVKA